MSFKRVSRTILAVVLLLSIMNVNAAVYGNTVNISNAQNYNRILFVIDCSNSMNSNDEAKLINEIVKMFVDGSYSAKTEIGFVTYNDKILSTYPLTPLTSEASRSEIKSAIDATKRLGSTDIGMALNHAMNVIAEGSEENGKPVIVLFSDGETDLTYTKTGRTYMDSEADENEAYAKSKQLGCPIYSVGISKNGTLKTEYLQKIAKNTSGKEYEIQTTKQLLAVYNTLFTDIMGTDVITKDIIHGTGAPQSITIDIPGNYVDESNIVLQHNLKLQNVSITNGPTTSSIYESANFVGVKMNNPDKNSVTINFTAKKDDEIKVNVTNFINVLPKVATPNHLSAKEVTIEAKLYSLDGDRVLTEETFYKGLTAELLVTNNDTGESVSVPMENASTSFVTVYKNEVPQSHDFQVRVTGQDYLTESSALQVLFTNSIPEYTGEVDELLLKNGNNREYELKDYFKDADDDVLSYAIDGQTSVASIEENKLIVTPEKEGKNNISVSASDGRGGVVVGNFKFDILPFWIYYKTPIIIIGSIFIILLLAYLLFARKTRRPVPASVLTYAPFIPSSGARFNGARFEGYFLNTLSGNEVPVLNWNASYIENKQAVSLGELLSMLDVKEKVPEAYKIYLEAGNNGTLVFYHDTGCIVSLGKRNIPEGKKEVLSYDDRLYIIFEDHVTEIELRYKRVRKMAMA